MTGRRVAVIGNAGVDTCVFFPAGDPAWDRETFFTENLDTVGQAGAYASLGYARLGHRPTFFGHVGDDPWGHRVRATLAAGGVDVRGLVTDEAGTARSVNLMRADGTRTGCYDGKGHRDFEPDLARCAELLRGCALAHVHIPDWARRLLPLIHREGMPLAVDLQDLQGAEDPYRADFIAAADVAFLSAVAVGDPASVAGDLRAARPRLTVVVGMGARGCLLATAEGIRTFPPPPSDLPVVDTNGAGDALAVGFLTARILEGRSLEDAVLRGQLAARHACSLRATCEGLITAAELEARAAGFSSP